MTKDETKDKLKAALAGVEKDESGHIIVLSPYGFKMIELDGKKYVCSLTEGEWRGIAKGRKFDLGDCYTPSVQSYCLQGSCSRNCHLEFQQGGYWVCICSY